MKVWIPSDDGLALLGAVPEGVTVEIFADPDRPPSDPAGVEFWTPPFGPNPPAARLVPAMAGLRRTQTPSGPTSVPAGYNTGIRPCPTRPQPTPEPRLAPTTTLTQALMQHGLGLCG